MMKRIYLSSAPNSLFLLIGSDPNVSGHQFLQLQGLETAELDLEIELTNDQFTTVFSKLYKNIRVKSNALLEYFTYLPHGSYILSIRANQKEVKVNITF